MSEKTPYSIVSIDPAEIDIGHEAPFRVRRHLPGEPGAGEADGRLVESVRLHGVLHPPLIARVGESSRAMPHLATTRGSTRNRPLLVQGFRRMAAARQAGLCAVAAVQLAIDDHPADIVLRWHEDLRCGEPLSEYERILRLEKLRALDAEAPLATLSEAYGKKLSEKHLSQLLTLLKLDEQALEALHRGDVSTGDLLLVTEHPNVDTAGAVRILSGERLSRSDQKKAVHLMLRIGDGGDEAWERFAGSYVPGSGTLLAALGRAVHPTLTGDLERIERIIRDMRLPPGVTITPPENMEGGAYRLQMPIRDEGAVREAIEKLSDAVDGERIAALLGILRGE